MTSEAPFGAGRVTPPDLLGPRGDLASIADTAPGRIIGAIAPGSAHGRSPGLQRRAATGHVSGSRPSAYVLG